MTATKAAIGSTAGQEPLRSALATRRPAMPTYIGLRVSVLGPDTTRDDAREGSNGSSVVRWARNRLAAPPARASDAAAAAAAATRRGADEGGAPRDNPCWASAATSARSGGGGRFMGPRCHGDRPAPSPTTPQSCRTVRL